MVEYRSVPDERRDVFYEYVAYAFHPEDGPPEYDPEEHDDERSAMGSRRGLYRDGAPDDADPLCVCRHYWFDARVRGDIYPAAGLSAVASPPENRRDGYVRRLLECSLEEYRERGVHVSVLWPFRYRFYRKYGWDTCNKRTTYECDPDALSFATEALDERETDGRFRRLEADDYDELLPAYEAHVGAYALSLDRDESWWRHRVFGSWTTDPFVYAWERDGDVRGYLVYTIDGEWGDRTMTVTELAFVDHEAFLALCSFCHRHDSQVHTVKLDTPESSELLDLAPDPEDIDCDVSTGPMVRIVDVAETLAALTYPETETVTRDRDRNRNRNPGEERVKIAVEDPLVEWNDATFELEVADGEATCEPLGEDADPDTDLEIDIGALSQLAVGYRSVTTLERTGRLTADDERTIATLERLFPTEPVYLRDRF